MGCDIHMHVEKHNGTAWVHVPKNDPDHYDWSEWDLPRNYNLFGILANVRNGWGFAGCDTGDRFKPISEPRGLPDDISTGLNRINMGLDRRDDKSAWLGDHSFSWLLLSEVLAYDFEQVTKRRGWVSLEQYRAFKATGEPPTSWSGGASGSLVENMTPEQADLVTDDMRGVHKRMIYVHIEWPQRYRDCVSDEFFAMIEELKKLGDPDKVRLVFGFDS